MFTGVLSLFFALSILFEAEKLSTAVMRVTGLTEIMTSPDYFRYIGAAIFILGVLIISSAVTRSMLHFEKRTVFKRLVLHMSKDCGKRIDDRAKEILALIVILVLAFGMTSPTLKALLGEQAWTHFAATFMITLGFITLATLMVLITRTSLGYLLAMYEAHRELTRAPLREIPEIEETS